MESLENRNPIAIFLYFAAAAGIAMFSMNPVLLAMAFVGAITFSLMRGRGAVSSHLFFFLTFALVAFVTPLFSHNGATVLLVVNNNPITAEAFVYGIFSGLMLLSVLYFFRSFSGMMTSDKLLYLFGRLSAKLALILSMALRYIPLFLAQMKKTAAVQKSMGYGGGESVVSRLRAWVRVFSVMVTWALENGIVTADSMEARGYGIGRRSSFALYRFRVADGVFCALTALLFGTVTAGNLLGAVDFSYYPTFVLRINGAFGYVAYGAYGTLVLLPIILEVGEKIKWKCLRSKI